MSTDAFVLSNYESISKEDWTMGPQTGKREYFRKISLVPLSIDLLNPPPRKPSDVHFTPQTEKSDYPADEG
ncbi:hypothetical protein O181_063015 [Austropuccinia psidii MF-1]|uniref:Uncharacterized protein n=1 Tax=Austropuccinia psidii MF-1 TaxID=1389203 RepID=A0A9Q3I1U8_9BASI|nr:hypothetical protein [Austropuccinia psidii MF-1]